MNEFDDIVHLDPTELVLLTLESRNVSTRTSHVKDLEMDLPFI